MIVLTVISFNGAAVSMAPVSLDELGGTIGRADTNQLVLPDQERMISRVHAQVVFRSGSYALIDRGSNAVLHNGKPVGNGREVPLEAGDDIQIGGYLIRPSLQSAAQSDDPFADFESSGFTSTNPIAPKLGTVPATTRDIPKPPASRVTSAVASAAPAKPSGIPDDWDPFRPDPMSVHTGLGQGATGGDSGLRPGPGQPREFSVSAAISAGPNDQSIDALFGLGDGGPGSDPFGGIASREMEAKPNTSGSSDPMHALLHPTGPNAITSGDHDSDLQAPWSNSSPSTNSRQVATPTALPGAVFSWDPPAAQEPVSTPLSPAPMPMPTPVIGVPLPAEIPLAVPQRRVGASSQEVPPRSFVQGTDEQKLLSAFLQGVGSPDLKLAPLNVEFMYQLGQLLRESTKGTVELLAARTALKKEVRAEVTVMVSNANNALKFSPSVDFALKYLLLPPTAGFLKPVESMRDAYDDLKAHQLGVMAGMRAALSDILKRFDPAGLEERLAKRPSRTSLMPSGKKTRLWELFQELYEELAHEAQEDFEELFGRAFVREYERCIAQLNSGKHS